MVQALMRHVLQEQYSDKLWKQALSRRASGGLQGELEKIGSSLPQDLDMIVGDDLEDDQSVIMQQWEAIAKRREAAKVAKDKLLAQAERLQPPRPSVAAASTTSRRDGSAGPRPRTFVARPANGYSQAQAKQWLPPGASISKDDRRENRWRVRSPFLRDLGGGAERSKSFGTSSGLCDFQAMSFCLRLVWRAYLMSHGGECSVELEEYIAWHLPSRPIQMLQLELCAQKHTHTLAIESYSPVSSSRFAPRLGSGAPGGSRARCCLTRGGLSGNRPLGGIYAITIAPLATMPLPRLTEIAHPPRLPISPRSLGGGARPLQPTEGRRISGLVPHNRSRTNLAPTESTKDE